MKKKFKDRQPKITMLCNFENNYGTVTTLVVNFDDVSLMAIICW